MQSKLDGSFTPRFFFGKKILQGHKRFDAVVGELYSSVKGDKVEDEYLRAKVNNTGKDLTLQLLCKLLNTSDDQIMIKNSLFCQRAIYAHHAQNAYKTRKSQLAAQARQ